jgi:hypothetical protein
MSIKPASRGRQNKYYCIVLGFQGTTSGANKHVFCWHLVRPDGRRVNSQSQSFRRSSIRCTFFHLFLHFSSVLLRDFSSFWSLFGMSLSGTLTFVSHRTMHDITPIARCIVQKGCIRIISLRLPGSGIQVTFYSRRISHTSIVLGVKFRCFRSLDIDLVMKKQ